MSMRDLGLIFNNTLGMVRHVNYIYKSSFYQIRNIELIRKYKNDKTCKTLVQAIIISQPDYDNTLLYNILQTTYVELGNIHLQEGTCKTSFVPAS